MPDTANLYTTLKNISASPKVFSFIPPHGKTLVAGQSVTVFGDIWDGLRKGTRPAPRLQASFEKALLDNVLEIIRTPSPLYFDATATTVKRLAVTAGVVGIADPSWGSYTGPA